MNAKSKFQGMTLVELMVVMAVGAIFSMAVMEVYGLTILRSASRLSVQGTYILNVEPIQRLFKVAQGYRYSVYASLANAQVGNRANAVASGTFCRFDRRDGGGWFLLYYDVANHQLNLAPGATGSSNLRWTAPLSDSFENALFDCSGGYLAMLCTQEVRMVGHNIAGGAIIRSRNVGGRTVVDYLIQMEPTHD